MGGKDQRHAIAERGLSNLVAEQGHGQQRPGRAPQQGAAQQRHLGDAPAAAFCLGLVPAIEDERRGAEHTHPDQQQPQGLRHRNHLHYYLIICICGEAVDRCVLRSAAILYHSFDGGGRASERKNVEFRKNCLDKPGGRGYNRQR